MRILTVFFLGFAALLFAGEPFGGPGVSFPWQTAEKEGIGTAFEEYDKDLTYSSRSQTAPISTVWFTIARGILTEVYYPRVDRAQTRDTQFLITDGKTFLAEEQFDTNHLVRRLPGSAAFKIINRDMQGRFEIEKIIWADPDSQSVIQHVTLRRFVDGLQFYLLHKPAAGNNFFGDQAKTTPLRAWDENPHFGAWQGLSSSLPWKSESVGYVGKSDGYTDLNEDKKMDFHFQEARPGNVALMAELSIPMFKGETEFTLFLSFAKSETELLQQLNKNEKTDSKVNLTKFIDQWRSYLSRLDRDLSIRENESRDWLLETSILILKSSEDKNFPGGVIASLSYPWGEDKMETPSTSPTSNHGYHAVWPRDLYHMANAFLAVNDRQTARAILENLKRAQFSEFDGYWELGPRRRQKGGSFPQNYWVDGSVIWGGYQADETAQPILLAYRLWKLGAIKLEEGWHLVREAANFLAGAGPWTHQERWEENHGISPNTAGFVISALAAASEMASAQGESGLAAKWLFLADEWATKPGDNLEAWTFTTNGKIQAPLGNGKYYLRIDGAGCEPPEGQSPFNMPWNPNLDHWLCISNVNSGTKYRPESEVVDGGFLELVRLGVRAANNFFIRESLPEMDQFLRRQTALGPSWYRYRYDAYGEGGKGRLWPLLTGERIHYEIQRLLETREPNPGRVLEHKLQDFESLATETGIFSEQVWDEGEKSGKATGAASPLGWAHAEYIQLLRSLKDNRVFEEIPLVRERYGKQ